jgi:uncharacterized protein (TIGR03067 family)
MHAIILGWLWPTSALAAFGVAFFRRHVGRPRCVRSWLCGFGLSAVLLGIVWPANVLGQQANIEEQPLTLDMARFYHVAKDAEKVLKPFAGRQVVDGLPFQIGGPIRLWSQTVADRGQPDFPDTLQGLRIGRTFDELHLVHFAMWPDAEGQTVAYICLNYADGTKFIFPVRYGAQVRDWYFLPSYEKELPTDPDTKICWRRPPANYKAPVRLFKTKLTNPLPQKAVESMDVVSARSLACYVLLAATVANRDSARPVTPPVAAEEPERKFDGKLTIHVLDDATGKPIEGALVEPGMHVRDEGVVGPPFYTSSAGEGIVDYPVEQTSSLSASVKKEGYRSKAYGWSRHVPSTYTFQLTRTGNIAQVQAAPLPSAAGAVPSPPTTAISGPWQGVSMAQSGQQLPDVNVRQLLLVFSEKSCTLRVRSTLLAETPCTVDAKATPATIDMPFNGQVTLGIWERKGNDLRICLNESSKGRPSAIPAKFGSGCDVDIRLKRADLQWSVLHVMDADGSHSHVLVTHPEYTSAGSPEWSWDSRKLAFDAWRSIRGETYLTPHILTCNADGTDLKELGVGAMPSWSPDGKRLTFSCYTPNNAVWTMNADGTERQLLDADGWGSEWCPKGDQIAYTVYDSGGNIRVRDLGKGTSRDLLDDRYQQIEWGMAWSPDGQWLAFKGTTNDRKTEAAVVHVDGMKKGFRALLPQALPEVKNIGQPLSWSSDSKQVLTTLKTQSGPAFQLYVIDADGKTPAKLLPGQKPERPYSNMAWSPDGKHIAYCAPPEQEPAPPKGD